MLSALVEAAKAAAEILLAMQGGELKAEDRGARGVRTLADVRAQDAFVEIFSRLVRDVPILGEEQDQPKLAGSRFVALDPLDGTNIYRFGSEHFGVSAVYVEDSVPISAVILQPRREVLVTAECGKGCYINNRRILLTEDASLADGILGLDFFRTTPPEYLQQVVSPLAGRGRLLRMLGASVAGIIDLLEGQTCAYVPVPNKIWDIGAGCLAVKEAGGTVLTWEGKPVILDRISLAAVFAANRRIAGEILAVIEPSR